MTIVNFARERYTDDNKLDNLNLALGQLAFNLPGESDFDISPKVVSALNELSEKSDIEKRGAIFTRVEVVEFILDLVGYTKDLPLHQKRILEPSFGKGDFLLPIIGRLLKAWRGSNNTRTAEEDLSDAICAVELHRHTFTSTREAVLEKLEHEGLSRKTAVALADQWLIQADYLLTPINDRFEFIVGNPPYVRQERIPQALMREYRRRFPTLFDRADLYIPFIERSLLMLKDRGRLGFICANRWIKNRYGGPLRELIAKHFHLKYFVDMVDTPAFQSDVIAYPAVTIISREKPGTTRIAQRPVIDRESLLNLAIELSADQSNRENGRILEIPNVTNRDEPWLLDNPEQTALIYRLEQNLPTIEDVGCKVGIGVATGADRAFIGEYETMDVEPDCKLPLVTTSDIKSGEVKWNGQGIINPFCEDGRLVNLNDCPQLRRYLTERQDIIKSRHCAKKNPAKWFRTIDRITPALARKPKLLVPDIKGQAQVVFEPGVLYPHHNLYYITADDWDLRALQAVLLSRVSQLFIENYSTKMRGGYFRFQAQYLRRIRIPRWQDVPMRLRGQLQTAAEHINLDACNSATYRLYGLSAEEISIVENREH